MPASAQPLLLVPQGSIIGEMVEDETGAQLAGAGDVDGDGHPDLLIGARFNDEAADDAGQVYLVLGSSWPWALDMLMNGVAAATFLGEAEDDYAGTSLDAAGDVDGDGYDDIIIGAFGNDEMGAGAGQAYLVLGRPAGWTLDSPLALSDASFLGEGSTEYAGISVSGVGDVDGDGYDDMLIGAYWSPEAYYRGGQAYLVLGRPSGWAMDTSLALSDASFLAQAPDDHAGNATGGAGDVDGDGLDDLLIAAEENDFADTNAGKVYLILGRSTGWTMDASLGTSDASFLGEGFMHKAGENAVAGAGDVNGDGLDDFLIGAPGAGLGEAYLILGRVSGWTNNTSLASADASFVGEALGAAAGHTVAAAGDVDGDGLDDFLIGDPHCELVDWQSGIAYLVRGRTSGWIMDESLEYADAYDYGLSPHGQMGEAVAGVGDLDGDGLDDFVIGAPNATSGIERGEIFVYLGASGDDEDADGDGISAWDGDCDDSDPNVYPGAIETPDGVDEDCDGVVDNDTDAFDDDGDGYNEWDGDCDDGEALVNPGAPEYCNGIDDDCDGVLPAYEEDGDGDGYIECADCDDTDTSVYPGAPETCDDGVDADCADDLEETEEDDDGDGYSECGGDCDDTEGGVFPGAAEICNGVDDDCDPDTDEDADEDGDGYSPCDGDCDDSDASASPGSAEDCNGLDDDCNGVADDVDDDGDGYSACDLDCDDADAGVNPGTLEVPYDGVDQDCDGEDLNDVDGDGYDGGDTGDDCDDTDTTIHPGAHEQPYNGLDEDCDGADLTDVDGDGFVGGPSWTDCDDTDPAVHPDATEQCDDAVDNDCDGVADASDEDCLEPSAPAEGGCACSEGRAKGGTGAGVALLLASVFGFRGWRRRRWGPCRAGRPIVWSALVALCLLLSACQSTVENAPAEVEPCEENSWFYDGDGDSYGVDANYVVVCEPPHGYTDRGGDCDDSTATVHPEAQEVCDGADNDCDQEVDEGFTLQQWFADADADGYGDPESDVWEACEAPQGYVVNDTDCDDTDAEVNVEAEEVLCDGVDSNCDGVGGGVTAAVLSDLEYPTVADALAAAVSGDTVLVCPGTHTEQLFYSGAGIELTSLSGDTADTVLDGGGQQRILEVDSGSDLTVSHLTFSNGHAEATLKVAGCGAAIYAKDSVLTVDDCRFLDHHADGDGGAIWLQNNSDQQTTELYVSGCTFEGNEAGSDGGAIDIGGAEGLASAHISETTFDGNYADSDGGAISSGDRGDVVLTLVGCGFFDNSADHSGGAIAYSGWAHGSIDVSGSIFEGNHSASTGGTIGFSTWGSAELVLTECHIEDSESDQAGVLDLGGWSEWYEVHFSDVYVDSNVTSHEGSAAIEVTSHVEEAALWFDGGSIRGNSDGGVLLKDGATLYSDGVDWGAEATDNTVYDVDTAAAEYAQFTTGEVFTCVGNGTCS
jgi:predicted outer membrane repeat protein